MKLIDYIGENASDQEVIFDYCYLDRELLPVRDEDMSYRGPGSAFANTMQAQCPQVLRLYATCGECNDFEVIENTEKRLWIRYTDFR